MVAKHQHSKSELRSIPARHFGVRTAVVAAALFSCCALCAQYKLRQPSLAPADSSSADAKLLDDYVRSKGYVTPIVFDSSNIKQFWVDKSVLSQDKTISISLDKKTNEGFESVPLKIQLINVNERQDCKVEVISDTPDVSFSVADNKSKVLSSSSSEDSFVQYHVASSTFHLEDTPDYSFNLKFSSKSNDEISVKKIILSFSNNKNTSFLSSPGVLKINRDGVNVSSATLSEGNAIEVKGKRTRLFSNTFLIVSDKDVETSVKVKNVGDKPTRIYVGYAVYNKQQVMFDGRNYPYKDSSSVLTVVSSEAGSDKIIVDSYPEWAKSCYLALNAEEDLFDVPSTTFADGRIVEVKKLDDGKAEITMEKPFKTALEAGAKVRIHGRAGTYLYMHNKVLQPGEEEVFTSTIKKDNTFLQYSPKAFSRGVYSVKPLILSYSVDANEENTIVISDYTVSY